MECYMYARRYVCVCVRSEVPSNKEKLLKAPFDLYLLFISVFPDMFFFPALADVFPNGEVESSSVSRALHLVSFGSLCFFFNTSRDLVVTLVNRLH